MGNIWESAKFRIFESTIEGENRKQREKKGSGETGGRGQMGRIGGVQRLVNRMMGWRGRRGRGVLHIANVGWWGAHDLLKNAGKIGVIFEADFMADFLNGKKGLMNQQVVGPGDA